MEYYPRLFIEKQFLIQLGLILWSVDFLVLEWHVEFISTIKI